LLETLCAVFYLSVSVPWGHIRGKVWGPDHGCPVLCLHGWADNCGSFNTLIPLLPKECRYVAVDLPGHGRSSHRPPGVFYSFSAYIADVCRVVDGLQWNHFSIMGHSMGESHTSFSALYPEMVNAVILLDAYGFLPTDPREIPKVMRQGIDEMIQFEKKTNGKTRVYSYEKAVERLLSANPTLSEQSVHILLERGLAQVEGGTSLSSPSPLSENVVRTTLEQNIGCDTEMDISFACLPSCSCLPQHSVVTVTGDHHVHLNDPEIIAPLVSHFLQTKVLLQQPLAIKATMAVSERLMKMMI
uniref:Serine hydrolase like n=1 Tax=Echeneis naucrates TaxID=173247 RepID=A0A665X3E1_ECHNA